MLTLETLGMIWLIAQLNEVLLVDCSGLQHLIVCLTFDSSLIMGINIQLRVTCELTLSYSPASIYLLPGNIVNGYSVVSSTLSLLTGTLLSLICIKEISLGA